MPTALGVAAAIWLLGSLHFQNSVPIVKRAASLNPTSIEANAEDRYRLDERANVLAEIKRHPITGLGMGIPWAATAQTLSLESGEGEGREYVHFAALWFWLKLGILGLCAYIGVLLGEHVACVAGMEAQQRAAATRLRPRLRGRDGRPRGDRYDRQLHGCGRAFHRAVRRPGRAVGADRQDCPVPTGGVAVER